MFTESIFSPWTRRSWSSRTWKPGTWKLSHGNLKPGSLEPGNLEPGSRERENLEPGSPEHGNLELGNTMVEPGILEAEVSNLDLGYNTQHDLLRFTCIAGKKAVFLVDSGSTHDFLLSKFVEKHQLQTIADTLDEHGIFGKPGRRQQKCMRFVNSNATPNDETGRLHRKTVFRSVSTRQV